MAYDEYLIEMTVSEKEKEDSLLVELDSLYSERNELFRQADDSLPDERELARCYEKIEHIKTKLKRLKGKWDLPRGEKAPVSYLDFTNLIRGKLATFEAVEVAFYNDKISSIEQDIRREKDRINDGLSRLASNGHLEKREDIKQFSVFWKSLNKCENTQDLARGFMKISNAKNYFLYMLRKINHLIEEQQRLVYLRDENSSTSWLEYYIEAVEDSEGKDFESVFLLGKTYESFRRLEDDIETEKRKFKAKAGACSKSDWADEMGYSLYLKYWCVGQWVSHAAIEAEQFEHSDLLKSKGKIKTEKTISREVSKKNKYYRQWDDQVPSSGHRS